MRQQEISTRGSEQSLPASYCDCRWGCYEQQRSAAVTGLASECPSRTNLKCSICAYDKWSAHTPTMKRAQIALRLRGWLELANAPFSRGQGKIFSASSTAA